ncbi:MOSC domain-containing protein [Spongorhabdus nitratireducens]
MSQLAVYPVKSTRQIALQQCELDAFGLRNDRRWMVVTPEGQFLTQRQLPQMVLIDVQLTDNGISLQAPDMSLLDVAVPVLNPAGTREVLVWNDTVEALDAGDRAAVWLSGFLQRDCRLVYMPDSTFRQVDPRYAETGQRTGFADGFPLLLISEASLEGLNSKLESPVPMARFRPNLVISGCEPHAEDSWKRIRIGEVEFSLAKPCTRCVIPSINTDTAEKDSRMLKVLAGYRRDERKRVIFGMNLIHSGLGSITVGDKVEVIE